MEASLLAKFDRLPPGVAQALKGNPTFMDEDGPMREAVLRACPLSKSEMLERMPEETRAAIKVRGAGPKSNCSYLGCHCFQTE